MILLVGFYEDADAARRAELIDSLRRNCANPDIDRVVVFIEEPVTADALRQRQALFAEGKIRLVEHGRRLGFADLFAYANAHLSGAAVAIANADIFFDETLALLDRIRLPGQLLCLSRWDEQEDGSTRHFDNPSSQDAWIFEPPLPELACDFHLGVPGCDNRLAFEAERAGLLVSNPSRSLRAHHLHRSAIHRYGEGDRLAGPSQAVAATFLEPSGERPPAGEFPSHRGRRADARVDARQRELLAWLAPHFDSVVPQALRVELRRALARSTEDPAPPDEAPLAVVAFAESMGYTVAPLEIGASTHNNERRALVSIPALIEGLSFTQVVANRSAPVDITFCRSGRLFVLAATGWDGYAPLAAFLDDAGWRAPVEPLRTSDGTRFEVWSLNAKADERLRVPAQAMLVGEQLIRQS